MRTKVFLQIFAVIALAIVLWLIFPSFAVFAEGAALSIRRFWWLILGFGLFCWSIWVISKRNK